MAKTKSALEKLTDFINWFMGSWIGVVLHAIWFSAWLYYDFSIESLTLAVSLEAIFIGIFLLMAANEAEAAREKKEALERAKDRHELKSDVSLDEQQLIILKKIQKDLGTLQDEVAKLKVKK